MSETSKYSRYLLDENSLARNILEEVYHPNCPTDIAEKLDTSSQSVNNYLKNLSREGWVKKSRKSGRKQKYRVTDKGRKFLYLNEQRKELDDEIAEMVGVD